MKITTKRGDKGKTYILGGKVVQKCDLSIEAQGVLDEAIAFLGFAKTKLKNVSVRQTIASIQRDLFRIIAEIARCKKGAPKFERPVTEQDVNRLEKFGDTLDEKLKVPSCFVIPGVNERSASLHIARTVIRRAERVLAALNKKTKINPHILAYLNRLSDLLFIMALYEEGRPHLLKYE